MRAPLKAPVLEHRAQSSTERYRPSAALHRLPGRACTNQIATAGMMANAHSLTHSLTRSQILKDHITYPHKQLSCPLFSACAARCKYRPGVRQRATLGGGAKCELSSIAKLSPILDACAHCSCLYNSGRLVTSSSSGEHVVARGYLDTRCFFSCGTVVMVTSLLLRNTCLVCGAALWS